eukprot:scaffold5181_cov125-Isochrysis_galbana.AAC.12
MSLIACLVSLFALPITLSHMLSPRHCPQIQAGGNLVRSWSLTICRSCIPLCTWCGRTQGSGWRRKKPRMAAMHKSNEPGSTTCPAIHAGSRKRTAGLANRWSASTMVAKSLLCRIARPMDWLTAFMHKLV